MQLSQGSVIKLLVVELAGAGHCTVGIVLIALLLLFRRKFLFLLRRLRLLRWLGFEISFQVSDAQLAPVKAGVPVESRVLHRTIASVRTVNGAQHDGAVFHSAADGPQLVHGPGKGHGSSAWHQSKCRTQPGSPATRGRRRN